MLISVDGIAHDFTVSERPVLTTTVAAEDMIASAKAETLNTPKIRSVFPETWLWDIVSIGFVLSLNRCYAA